MNSPPPPPRHPLQGLRRLLSLARPEAPLLAGAVACLALGSAGSLAFPRMMGSLIDGTLAEGGSAALDRTALAMGALFLVQGVALSLRYYLFSLVGERVVSRLRESLYERLLEQEVAFFDGRRTGELTSRLGSDTTVVQSAVSANISMALRHLATVVGGVALLLATSPTLTALMLAVVPPVALGAFAYGRRVRKLGREAQDALARSNEVAEETLSGIRTVRSFAAEEAELARYQGALSVQLELARRRVRTSATFLGLSSFLGLAAAVLVLWYGGRLVQQGQLSVGSLTSFLVYTLLVAFALGALSELWADVSRAAGAAERCFELLDRVPAMNSHGGKAPSRVQGRLRLERVSFSYPARPTQRALEGVELELAPGEQVAVVGPSGAGKSTLAALLSRLYDPDVGRILLDGTPLPELDPRWLRQQIGVVAQEPLLFSTSVGENIRYGRPGASDEEVQRAAVAAHAHGFISQLPAGYATAVGERGVQLSGGQRQRVAIARAVLKDPRVLVLDEATSALDAESEQLVKDALERLMKGRTTLIIAHRLSTVVGADRVLVMENGRIVQSGPHEALVAQAGLYRRLVERQFVQA